MQDMRLEASAQQSNLWSTTVLARQNWARVVNGKRSGIGVCKFNLSA